MMRRIASCRIVSAALLAKDAIAKLTDQMNYRHRMAQYASRASVELHTLLFFKGKVMTLASEPPPPPSMRLEPTHFARCRWWTRMAM
jgi:hypothetical protein